MTAITQPWSRSTGGEVRRHAAVLAILASAILLLFARDAADMVRVWAESSTYNHCALVPLLIAWLVWQRLPELKALVPAALPAALPVVAIGAALWLLGEAGGVATARHLGLVVMLQGAVITVLGLSFARALAFPIFYALFMVPAGEEIVPQMQMLTARIAVALLHLGGVPAHLDGVFISIPNGYFEVAEACAGVKFLVAMLALGALVANVCFRSWPRRILFMLACIVTPIIANGVRAFATIQAAAWSDADVAAGFDHVIYGGIFFAIVMAIVIGVAWPFFDRRASDPWFDPALVQPRYPVRSPLTSATVACLAIAALPIAWIGIANAPGEPLPATMMPEVPGWQLGPDRSTRRWQPHFAGADRLVIGHYHDAHGRQVDLAIAVFARQEEGRELVGFGQGAVGPDSDWAWSASASPLGSGRYDRITAFGTAREVATFYRVGGVLTGSATDVKLATMRLRLFGGPSAAAAILISAEGDGARPAIERFAASLGDIAGLADRTVGLSQAH